MKYSFKIGSLRGIPIELHLTFILLMGAVLVLTFPQWYLFTLILFLFIFVTFHEFAHAIVAKHYNIKVRRIVLYPIGGVSEIEEIPSNPSIEWRLAIAGPLTSFLIGGILFAINLLITVTVPITSIDPTIPTAGDLILDLAILNLILGGFNLLPAFPMDGGRVFRALLAQRMSFSDATKYASYIGRAFGIAMVVAGIIFPGYFLLILVGVFVYIGASGEAEQTIVSTALARVRVSDVMCSAVVTVTPETPVNEALENMFKARYHDSIVEKDGNFEGIAKWEELSKTAPEQRSQLKISQIPLKKVSVFPGDAALEAQKLMEREKISVLPVVDPKEPTKIVCVLTTEGINRAYEKAKNLR